MTPFPNPSIVPPILCKVSRPSNVIVPLLYIRDFSLFKIESASIVTSSRPAIVLPLWADNSSCTSLTALSFSSYTLDSSLIWFKYSSCSVFDVKAVVSTA